MAECIECGTQMGFGIKGYCGICHVARLNTSKDAPMSVSSLETPITSKSNKPSSQTASEGSTPAATAFTSLAWVIVALTFICTVPTVPTVLTARRHLEAPSMPRVPINRTPSHLADTSDPCQRPMQTDGHGHPPKGVSSCPVGKIRRWGGPIMRLAKHLGIDVLPPQLALTA